MSGYLTYLLVAQQEAHLAERARRAPPPHVLRPGHRHPGRLRTRTARLLVGLAFRLDDRLQPPAARVVPSGAHT
jgi:hypothetical protein